MIPVVSDGGKVGGFSSRRGCSVFVVFFFFVIMEILPSEFRTRTLILTPVYDVIPCGQ